MGHETYKVNFTPTTPLIRETLERQEGLSPGAEAIVTWGGRDALLHKGIECIDGLTRRQAAAAYARTAAGAIHLILDITTAQYAGALRIPLEYPRYSASARQDRRQLLPLPRQHWPPQGLWSCLCYWRRRSQILAQSTRTPVAVLSSPPKSEVLEQCDCRLATACCECGHQGQAQ